MSERGEKSDKQKLGHYRRKRDEVTYKRVKGNFAKFAKTN
jgi:hypothetical protein